MSNLVYLPFICKVVVIPTSHNYCENDMKVSPLTESRVTRDIKVFDSIPSTQYVFNIPIVSPGKIKQTNKQTMQPCYYQLGFLAIEMVSLMNSPNYRP